MSVDPDIVLVIKQAAVGYAVKYVLDKAIRSKTVQNLKDRAKKKAVFIKYRIADFLRKQKLLK